MQLIANSIPDVTRLRRKSLTKKRDLGKEMWTVGFRVSWRKMKMAAQDRAGWTRVVCDMGFAVSNKAEVFVCFVSVVKWYALSCRSEGV